MIIIINYTLPIFPKQEQSETIPGADLNSWSVFVDNFNEKSLLSVMAWEIQNN
jgi:hypothetical protein